MRFKMIVVRIKFIFVLFSLPILQLSAQSLLEELTVEQLFGRSGRDQLVDMVENTGRQIAAVGNAATGENGGSDIYFLLLDKNLQKITDRHIGRGNDDGVFSIALAPNGNYLLAGYSTTPSNDKKSTSAYKGKRDAWFLMLNDKGQTLQELIFGSSEDDEWKEVIISTDKTLLLAGNSGNGAWVVKTSSEGQILWEKKLKYNNRITQLNSAVQTSSNSIVLTGYADDGKNKWLWLCALDDNGNTLWEKSYPPTEANEGFSVVELSNNRLGIVGYLYSDDFLENGFLQVVDFEGKKLNYQSFGGRSDDRFFDLEELHNGRIVLIGRSKSFSRGSRRDRIWTVLLNTDGSTRDEQYYGSKETDEGYAIIQRYDGSILGAGFTSQNILKSSQGWIAQLTKAINSNETAALLSLNVDSVHYSNGEYLQPNEKTYLSVTISNPTKLSLTNLKILISSKDNLAPSFQEVFVAPLQENTSKVIHIPIPNSDQLKEGLFDYTIQLIDKETIRSEKKTFQLRTGALSMPKLKISYLGSRAVDANKQTVKFSIKNEGNKTAESLSLFVNIALQLETASSVQLGNLAPQEEKIYELPFEVPATYPSDSVRIRVRAVDASYEHSGYLEINVPATTYQPIATVDTIKTKDFVTAIWIYPNPDYYERKEIVWNSTEITIQIKIVSNKSLDKQSLCIEVNQVPCNTGAKMDEVTMKGNKFSRTYIQKIKLQEGTNLIRASARNEAGEIEVETLNIIYTPRKPILHILAIGVPSVDLKYTTQDASDFVKAIQGIQINNDAFQNIFIDTLTSETTTTKTEILKTLKKLQYRYYDNQIMPQDLVIVFISSHGVSTADGEFRIASSDYDGPFLQETSLDFETEIVDYLKPILCNKLFFIDACHSGASVQNMPLWQATGSNIVELASAQKEVNLLLSCRANEYSYEDESWKNGAFTEVLVQSINAFTQKQSNIDTNKDNQLDIHELYGQLTIKVPQLIQGKRPKTATSQSPLLIATEANKPIVLFKLPVN